MAKKFPDTNFAITDYPVEAAPFADKKGKLALHERRGPDLRGERGRLPRRCPRRAQGGGGSARRRSAPSAASRSRRSTSGSRATSSARRWPCRARRCSSATRRTSSPPTSARRSPRTRSPRARRCSSRSPAAAASATLKAADEAGKWGIGVDVDQYKLGKRVLTSGDQARRQRRLPGDPAGEGRQVRRAAPTCVFNLKNGGIGLGKMNPAVTAADKAAMNGYKARIISGKLKLPSRRSRRRGSRRSPRGGPQARPSLFPGRLGSLPNERAS